MNYEHGTAERYEAHILISSTVISRIFKKMTQRYQTVIQLCSKGGKRLCFFYPGNLSLGLKKFQKKSLRFIYHCHETDPKI